MQIKLSLNDTNKLLWRDSPCTLRNVLQNPSLDKAKRFQIGSIYHRDQVTKPKKIFTQFEKPELLLLNFRRQIEEATAKHRTEFSINRQNNGGASKDKKINRKLTLPKDIKFYEIPLKLDLKHDRHGNRSNYAGEYDIKQISDRIHLTRKNFYSSQRIDLSKPHNFYPGPGAYFLENEEARREMNKTDAKYNKRSKSEHQTLTQRAMEMKSKNQ